MPLHSLRTQFRLFVVLITLASLLGLGALFYHSLKTYHRDQAQAQMNSGFYAFEETLSELKANLIVAKSGLYQHQSFLPSMRVIQEYETPKNAQAYLFDHEKEELTQNLNEGFLLGRYQQAYLFKPNGDLISFFQNHRAQPLYGYQPGGHHKQTLRFESQNKRPASEVFNDAERIWSQSEDVLPPAQTPASSQAFFLTQSPFQSDDWLMASVSRIQTLSGEPAGRLVLMASLAPLAVDSLFDDLKLAVFDQTTGQPIVHTDTRLPFRWEEVAQLPHDGRLIETQYGLIQHFESAFGQRQLEAVFLYPTDVLNQELQQAQSALWWSLIALILLVLPVNYAVFHHTLHRPLSKLMRGIGRIQQGDYRQKIDLRSKNEMGQLANAYNSMVDEIHAREEDLKISAKMFESNVGMVITDAHNTIIQANKAYAAMAGWSVRELIGQKPSLFKSGRHGTAFYQQMWHQLLQKGHWSGEIWNRRKNGEVYPQWLTITAVKNDQGDIPHYLATAQDITDKKAAEEQITQLAFYDPLTHLANRRKLFSQLDALLNQLKAENRHAAIFFIDLDDFKDLNDSRGHEIGDLFLVKVAEQLRTVMLEEDRLLARLGGDEFVAISLKNLSDQAYQSQGLAIRRALNSPIELEGKTYRSSPSIGMVVITPETESVTEILKKADQAMYYAKRSGKNQLQVYTDDIDLAVQKKKQLKRDIELALEHDQFVLYYQPQIGRENALVGAEALIRWQHPERGMVPPFEFIPFAEETGQIVAIGDWVIQSACRQLQAWSKHPDTAHLTIAVNVSIDQFMQENFVSKTLKALHQANANPPQLELELTENVFITQPDLIGQKMAELQAVGIRFALDDFGTGYSSLSYLKSLPLDQLKIDQTFVRDLLDDENDEAIVTTVISLAKTLKLDVIAEGVETEAHQQRLAELGCHAYQGFYYSKPVPADDMIKNLMKKV
jgi:diguanylate cyclase (GGDEF)-like protein/PAS domain S-box-containing protein